MADSQHNAQIPSDNLDPHPAWLADYLAARAQFRGAPAAVQEIQDAAYDALWRMVERIANTPAATIQGGAAQLALLVEINEPGNWDDDPVLEAAVRSALGVLIRLPEPASIAHTGRLADLWTQYQAAGVDIDQLSTSADDQAIAAECKRARDLANEILLAEAGTLPELTLQLRCLIASMDVAERDFAGTLEPHLSGQAVLQRLTDRLEALAADHERRQVGAATALERGQSCSDPHAGWMAEVSALYGAISSGDTPGAVELQAEDLRLQVLRTEAWTLAGACIQVELVAETLEHSDASEPCVNGLANAAATLRRLVGPGQSGHVVI